MTDQERRTVENVLLILDEYDFERSGNRRRVMLGTVTQQLDEMLQTDTVRRTSAQQTEGVPNSSFRAVRTT